MSAAEIVKAHDTGPRCNTQLCMHAFERRVGKKGSDDYLCPISMIYSCPLQVEMGHTIKHQIHCAQRKDEKNQHMDKLTQSRALWDQHWTAVLNMLQMWNWKKSNHINLRFFPLVAMHTTGFCIRAV